MTNQEIMKLNKKKFHLKVPLSVRVTNDSLRAIRIQLISKKILCLQPSPVKQRVSAQENVRANPSHLPRASKNLRQTDGTEDEGSLLATYIILFHHYHHTNDKVTRAKFY